MPPLSSAIPSHTFSTVELPAAARFEAWRDQMLPLFALELPDRRARPACDATLTMFHLGSALVSRVELAATSHRGLRPAQKIRRDPLDHYLVEIYTGGGSVGEAGSDEFALDAGDVGFFDLGQPFTMQSSRSESVAITLPRILVERLVPGAARMHGAVLRGGMAGLLGAHVQALYRHAPLLSPDQADAVAGATLAMVAACLAPTADSLRQAQGPIDSVLLRRAQQFIARNLHAPDLSVQRLCAALRVSRSHLYRAFAAQGGVAAYVQACRLAAASGALRDRGDRRRVSEIAYDHGFASAAHFSRAFRRRYGLSPADFRASAWADMPAPAAVARGDGVAHWLRTLGVDEG